MNIMNGTNSRRQLQTIIVLVSMLSGCSTSIWVEADFPRPLVEQLPVSMGLILDDDLLDYVHYEELPRQAAYTIQIGEANELMLVQLFESMFTDLTEYNEFPLIQPDSVEIDGVLWPELERFEFDVPIFLENATFLISYATIFLVLMALGIALTRLKVFSFRLSLINSFTRMVLGPIIGLLMISFFNLSGVEAGVLFIQSAMPSAILCYLVGSMYSPKKVVDSIASTIFVSTSISFVTLPFIVYIALRFFN